MRHRHALLAALLGTLQGLAGNPAKAEPPALVLNVVGSPQPAVAGAACDATDIPDAPARALRLADGTVQLYATDQRNRLDSGPDLLHLRHGCTGVMAGAGRDDPAAYDDRAWLATPWTRDGRTIWAVVHNEFHGHRRPASCPSGRYMDCWFNALTAAVSEDGGRTFARVPGQALVAALPYRYDEVGRGHHGYFNPSNIVTRDNAQFMFAFATRAAAQRPGNCLLRTEAIEHPERWRGWDGTGFGVVFIDPYTASAPIEPARHVCAPVGLNGLRWPVTSLVRHAPSGLFLAVMQDARRTGGIFYATSPDLVHWSDPALLLEAIGPGDWTCTDRPPLAFPSLLDPGSPDRNFETVGATAMLFATRFKITACRIGMDRELIRWAVTIEIP